MSEGELEFFQRDIIDDFLNLEDDTNLDVDILVAKLSLIVKFMKVLQHKNLKDFEFLYKRIKTSELAVNSS